MLESSWESRYLHFSLEQIQLNAQNPSNWEEANESLQVFPHWETPELACSNSRQVVLLSHPISKQSTWICDSNLARAQIEHQLWLKHPSARQAKLQAGTGFRQQPQSRARLKLLMGSLTLQPFYCCYLLRQPIQDTYSCSKLQFRLLAQWYLTGHFKQHKLLENVSFYHLCTEVLWFGHTNQPPCATPTNCCTPVLTHLCSAQCHCYPQQLQNGFQHQGLLLSSSELSRNILLAEGLRAQESIFHRNNQKKTSKSTLIGAEDSFLGSSSGLEQNALKVASITIAFKIKFNISFLKLTSL